MIVQFPHGIGSRYEFRINEMYGIVRNSLFGFENCKAYHYNSLQLAATGRPNHEIYARHNTAVSQDISVTDCASLEALYKGYDLEL